MPKLTQQIAGDTHKLALRLIRDHRELSGAQISRLTGLQPSTVVYILRRLNKSGFIEYSRTGESTNKGGKRPVLWRINGAFGYVLGMEVLVDKIRYVLTDFSGKIVRQNEIAYDSYLEQEAVSEELISIIQSIQKEHSLTNTEILGVGIAITGLIDNTDGVVRYSSNLNFYDLPLRELIEKYLDIPVYLVNDANAGALGIKWYAQQGETLPPNIIYITYNQISDYLGAGLILDNKLYQGAYGTAGEMFNALPDLNKAGKEAILKFDCDPSFRQKIEEGVHIALEDIFELARNSDMVAKQMVEAIIQFLAEEILMINGFINPNLIVLGGDIALGHDLILPSFVPEFKKKNKYYLNIDNNLPQIIFSRYGNYTVATGANAVIIKRILG